MNYKTNNKELIFLTIIICLLLFFCTAIISRLTTIEQTIEKQNEALLFMSKAIKKGYKNIDQTNMVLRNLLLGVEQSCNER